MRQGRLPGIATAGSNRENGGLGSRRLDESGLMG